MATPIPPNHARFDATEIALATNGTLHGTAPSVLVGVSTDSRSVGKDGIFVALRGESHDGHAFLEGAETRGAGLLVVDRKAAVGSRRTSMLEVDDTLVAWADLARHHVKRWRAGSPDRKVIAITGSAGKTTTKELCAALCAEVGRTHSTAGNLNNRIGVPAVVFGIEDHRIAVLEMGMSLPGEIEVLAAIAPPDVAVVTNVGVAHAEGVGGREGVMREKGAVYRALSEEGIGIVNADDSFARRAAANVARTISFGVSEAAQYRVTARATKADGATVTLACPTRTITVAFPLVGEAAAIDLAAALAAQEAATGVLLDEATIEHALTGVRVAGRSEIRTLAANVVLLDDSYNANPSSMRAALATLREMAGSRRRVAVLGEMKELGSLAEAEHRALGDVVAESAVDLVIGCGGLVDLALERAESRGITVVRAASTEEAAGLAAEKLRSGDAIVVKGSRGVGTERVVAAIVKASESLPSVSKSASSEAG